MKKDLFTDGVSHIDLDAVERLLQIEQHLQAKQRRQNRARWLIIPAAAMIALLVCMTAVIIPYIPRTLDIEYEPSKGAPENVWVYYQNENGTQKRERVHVPAGTQNVFAAWKHLNVVDDEVVIVDYKEQADDVQSTVVPGTLLEFLQQRFSPASKTVTVTLSAQITSYENYDALIESLTQTLAKYAGVAPEQIRILIDGEQIGTEFGGLQFYHNLHSTPMTVGVGSRLEITVGMINASSQNIEFTGSWGEFVPGAILTMGNTAVITHEPYDVTQEYQKYTLAPGESREMTYVFPIPEGAVCGEYDLLVTFGDDSLTFEKAVHVVAFGYIYDASTPFAEFLTQYGFDTADTEKFKAAVRALSLDGIGLLDIMNQAEVEWYEGYGGEIWSGDRFHYQFSIYSPLGVQLSCTNSFTAKVLPDGMTLPHGIAPEDTLAQALCKLGYTEEQAKKALQERKDIFFVNDLLFAGATLCVNFDSGSLFGNAYADITYEYGDVSMTLRYNQNTQSFEELLIEARSSEPLQVTFTGYQFMESVFSLSAQQCSTLAQMLSRAEIVNDTVELICDSTCLINGIPYSYDTTEGLFCGNGRTLYLTEQDREAFNQLLDQIQ